MWQRALALDQMADGVAVKGLVDRTDHEIVRQHVGGAAIRNTASCHEGAGGRGHREGWEFPIAAAAYLDRLTHAPLPPPA